MYRFASPFAPYLPASARHRSRAPRGEALQSLETADGLRDRFFCWRGISGRRYVCSIFQLGEANVVADVTSGLIIGVVREGTPRAVCLFRAGGDARMDTAALRRMARDLGVAEWHVLFAADEAATQDLSRSLLN